PLAKFTTPPEAKNRSAHDTVADPSAAASLALGRTAASKLYPLDAPLNAKALAEWVRRTSPLLKLRTPPEARKRSENASAPVPSAAASFVVGVTTALNR